MNVRSFIQLLAYDRWLKNHSPKEYTGFEALSPFREIKKMIITGQTKSDDSDWTSYRTFDNINQAKTWLNMPELIEHRIYIQFDDGFLGTYYPGDDIRIPEERQP